MSSRCTSSDPKEDVVFPRMLYCDSRCSQTLPGLSPELLCALLCNATRRLDDGKRVIPRQSVRGSVRAVRAVRNARVFQTETTVVADLVQWLLVITIDFVLIGFAFAHTCSSCKARGYTHPVTGVLRYSLWFQVQQ
jgi:hypothetical protein